DGIRGRNVTGVQTCALPLSEFFRWFSEEAVRFDGEYAQSADGKTRVMASREPVGPCILITPWNFPLAMGTRKIGPAIAAGCTMAIGRASCRDGVPRTGTGWT